MLIEHFVQQPREKQKNFLLKTKFQTLTCLPASLLCKLTIRTIRRRVINVSCSSINDTLTLRPNFKSSEQPPHSKPSFDGGGGGGDDDDGNKEILIDGIELDWYFNIARERMDDDDDVGWLLSQPHSVNSPLAQAFAMLCITEADVSA